jgi:hypothetical protein
MSSTVTTIEALLVGFTTLPSVSGKPTLEDISLAQHILNQNAMSIQYYGGGADHDHLGLVVTPIEYMMQVTGGYITHP